MSSTWTPVAVDGPWLAGAHYSLADTGMIPYLDRMQLLALAGLWEAHRPRVSDWFTRAQQRPSYDLAITRIQDARGVIVLAGAQAGLTIAEYAPREIKQALTGSGAASKEQVRFMVMRLLGLKESPPLDMSDALAVALTHAGRSQFSGLA